MCTDELQLANVIIGFDGEPPHTHTHTRTLVLAVMMMIHSSPPPTDFPLLPMFDKVRHRSDSVRRSSDSIKHSGDSVRPSIYIVTQFPTGNLVNVVFIY